MPIRNIVYRCFLVFLTLFLEFFFPCDFFNLFLYILRFTLFRVSLIPPSIGFTSFSLRSHKIILSPQDTIRLSFGLNDTE